MYDPFDPRTIAAAGARYDARLRHRIAENVRPRSLVTFPCPYSGKRLSVQRGGPSPTHAPSPLCYTLTLGPRPASPHRAARNAARRARRTPTPRTY